MTGLTLLLTGAVLLAAVILLLGGGQILLFVCMAVGAACAALLVSGGLRDQRKYKRQKRANLYLVALVVAVVIGFVLLQMGA